MPPEGGSILDSTEWTINGQEEVAIVAPPIVRNFEAYLDRLVVGDFDRDLVDEIGYFYRTETLITSNDWNPGTQYRLNVYDLAKTDPSTWFNPTPAASNTRTVAGLQAANLAAGDFTRQGVRVGRPTYRVQEEMVTPIMFLNLPPMHRDIVTDSSGQNTLIDIQSGARRHGDHQRNGAQFQQRAGV
jgi:hypothetical protein